jgi:hypothetical protein
MVEEESIIRKIKMLVREIFSKKLDWDKLVAIGTILLALASLVGLGISLKANENANENTQKIIDLTPSKYAYIEITLSEWTGDTIPISIYSIQEDKNQIGLNIINSGQMKTGEINLLYMTEPSDISIEVSNNITNIPSKDNYPIWINFSFVNNTNLIGIHNLPLRFACPNCRDQSVIINKKINICIYNNSVKDFYNATKNDCNVVFSH